MITAEQARNAQEIKQAELAAIAETEAQIQAEKDTAAAKALAESNMILANEIVEKAGWVSLKSLAGATEPEKEAALGSPTHMAS